MSDDARDGRQGPPMPPPLFELVPAPGGVFAAATPAAARPRYRLALVLFGLTFLCTTTLGPVMLGAVRTQIPLLTPEVIASVWMNAESLRLGLSFSFAALTILLAHEMGHYIACRIYRLPCTLPYFLPVPLNFGTFGAFIKLKAPIHSKRQLFDVGIAGPIAGFAALIPFLLYGVAKSKAVALRPSGNDIFLGTNLAIDLAIRLLHGGLGDDMSLRLHPFALAAWLGLLATAINLLPLGQLDGGHILYAVTGRLQRRLAFPLWVALGLLGFYWIGWFLWCAIIVLIGIYHPPVDDEDAPLDAKRRLLAALALVIFILAFIPIPLFSARP